MDLRTGSQRRDNPSPTSPAFSRFPAPSRLPRSHRISSLSSSCLISHHRQLVDTEATFLSGQRSISPGTTILTAYVTTRRPQLSAQARKQSTEKQPVVTETNSVDLFSKHRIPRRALKRIPRYRQGWPGDTKPPSSRGAQSSLGRITVDSFVPAARTHSLV